MEPALYSFLFFLFISSFVILILRSWLRSHWEEFRHAIRSPRTVRNIPFSNEEILPSQIRNVDPDAEPLVRAIHSSVERYKHLNTSFCEESYYWTAHSKRYVLRISLSPKGLTKYSLNVTLEGKHAHVFALAHRGWLSSRLVKMENQLYFTNPPSEGIAEAEIIPFLEPLSFFEKVTASEGILSATRTLHTETSIEDWPHVLGTFIRLARFLMDTGMRKEILAVEDVLCPYCRGQFTGAESTVSCRECKTRHHQECWEEVGRCSVFGCNCKSEMIVTQA